MSKRVSSILIYIYIIVAFGFMAYYLGVNRDELKYYDWQLNTTYLIGSIILTWLALLGPVVMFKSIFKKIANHQFSFPEIFKYFNLSFIGRYLPGKVWSMAGMVYFADRRGIGKRLSMTVVIINEICFKGSGLFWGLGYFLITRTHPELALAALAVMLLSLMIIHPVLLQKLIDSGSKLIKKETIKLNISYGSIIRFFLTYLIFWSIYGLSLYLLIKAVYPSTDIPILAAVSSLPLAWTVGFLAVIIPGGIGVREGMLVALLSIFIPAEIALVIAIIQRIIATLIEGINAGVSLMVKEGR